VVSSFLGERDNGALKRLLLVGEPGVGKSTLWRAGVEDALSGGFAVLEASPAAAERSLSFAALGDLLTGLREEIGGLPEPQRRALRVALVLEDPGEEPLQERHVAVALTELLRRCSRETDILLAVDDAQWLDDSSSAVLEFALRRLQGASVRVLATSRPGEDHRVEFRSPEQLEVGPLESDVLAALLRERLGTRFRRPVLRQLESASGGNPLYALELATNLLNSRETLEPGEQLVLPPRLRDLVAARLELLSPAGRNVALACAALARPTVSAAAEVVEKGELGIEDAIRAGVLERAGELLRFQHPLYAATVYEEASVQERRLMHERLAGVVVEPEEQALHLAESVDDQDERVAALVEAGAANAAARGAPDAAVRLARRSVELTPVDRRHAQHRRRLACARYAFIAGDPKHALELLERQLDVTEDDARRERAEIEFELGRASRLLEGIATAVAHYERALALLEGTQELRLQAEVTTELADMHLGDISGAGRTTSEVSAKAVRLAEELGDPGLLARALSLHGVTLADRGEPPSDSYWERALEIEAIAGDFRIGGPTHMYAMNLFERYETNRAEQLLTEVAKAMRSRADPSLPLVLSHLSDVERYAGRWEAATLYADEAYETAAETGQQSLEPFLLLCIARLSVLTGELERAEQQITEALALAERLPATGPRMAFDRRMVSNFAVWLRGRIAAISGRHDEAHELLHSEVEAVRESMSPQLFAELLAEDIAVLAAVGSVDEAAEELDELSRISREVDRPHVSAIEARSCGLVAAAEKKLDRAAAELDRSRELLETMEPPWLFELARTLLALGSVQRRARQKQAAQTALKRALEIFELLGARPLADQARAELERIGGRPARTGSLTDTERRVAECVARGSTNAEAARALFMSPKTVEWNLSKIYKKLHVKSRAELVAKLAKESAVSQL
jgi:DNA-binding CsgD family transcriptional regulator